MKVLQVIESSSGGSGRYTIELTCALLRRGHQVDLAYAEPRIDDRFRRGIVEITRLGGRCFSVPIELRIGPHDLKSVKALRKILKMHGPYDVLHLESSKAGAVGRLARIGRRQATVYTPHLLRTASPGLGRRSAAVYGGIERFLARWTDRIVLVSEFEYDHAVGQGLPEEKLVLIENCSDPQPMGDRAELRRELGVSEAEFVAGYVGRLAPQKDPLILLKAMTELADQPSIKLAVIGDGPLEDECRQFVSANGLSAGVTFLGPVNGPGWMSAFDAFVLPSASESWPNVVLEAAHASLPTVATRVGSIPKFVLDGESGIIVEPGDSSAIARALKALASERPRAQAMGALALERSRAYTVDGMTEKMEAVYREAVEAAGRQPSHL